MLKLHFIFFCNLYLNAELNQWVFFQSRLACMYIDQTIRYYLFYFKFRNTRIIGVECTNPIIKSLQMHAAN